MESINKLEIKRKLVQSAFTKLLTTINTFITSIDDHSETDQCKLSEYL